MHALSFNPFRIATIVAVLFLPSAMSAQSTGNCPEHSFNASAVWLRDDRLVVRGMAAQPVGNIGWSGSGLAAALAGSDSAVRYATDFARDRQRGVLLSLFSSIAGAFAGSRIHSIHDTKWVALGVGGIVATLAGGVYTVRAHTSAEHAIWWYNHDVSASSQSADTVANRPPSDSVLRSYVGIYEVSAAFRMEITLTGRILHVQATGQEPLELVPRADHEFDVSGVAARIRFTSEADGKVTSLTLFQNGSSAIAHRKP